MSTSNTNPLNSSAAERTSAAAPTCEETRQQLENLQKKLAAAISNSTVNSSTVPTTVTQAVAAPPPPIANAVAKLSAVQAVAAPLPPVANAVAALPAVRAVTIAVEAVQGTPSKKEMPIQCKRSLKNYVVNRFSVRSHSTSWNNYAPGYTIIQRNLEQEINTLCTSRDATIIQIKVGQLVPKNPLTLSNAIRGALGGETKIKLIYNRKGPDEELIRLAGAEIKMALLAGSEEMSSTELEGEIVICQKIKLDIEANRKRNLSDGDRIWKIQPKCLNMPHYQALLTVIREGFLELQQEDVATPAYKAIQDRMANAITEILKEKFPDLDVFDQLLSAAKAAVIVHHTQMEEMLRQAISPQPTPVVDPLAKDLTNQVLHTLLRKAPADRQGVRELADKYSDLFYNSRDFSPTIERLFAFTTAEIDEAFRQQAPAKFISSQAGRRDGGRMIMPSLTKETVELLTADEFGDKPISEDSWLGRSVIHVVGQLAESASQELYQKCTSDMFNGVLEKEKWMAQATLLLYNRTRYTDTPENRDLAEEVIAEKISELLSFYQVAYRNRGEEVELDDSIPGTVLATIHTQAKAAAEESMANQNKLWAKPAITPGRQLKLEHLAQKHRTECEQQAIAQGYLREAPDFNKVISDALRDTFKAEGETNRIYQQLYEWVFEEETNRAIALQDQALCAEVIAELKKNNGEHLYNRVENAEEFDAAVKRIMHPLSVRWLWGPKPLTRRDRFKQTSI